MIATCFFAETICANVSLYTIQAALNNCTLSVLWSGRRKQGQEMEWKSVVKCAVCGFLNFCAKTCIVGGHIGHTIPLSV